MTKNRCVTYSLVIACLLLAGTILYYIASNITNFNFSEQGTRLEFISDHNEKGFSKEKTIYTENGITTINFIGKITVNGTAEIAIIAANGNIVHSEIYKNMKSQTIRLEITNLFPNSYYIICFSSTDAQTGSLILSTSSPLVVHPEKPKR
jgi:hypothetical protein